MELVQLNSRGNGVVNLKQLLKKWGYQIDLTDTFDGGTDQAVRNFQRDNGLTVDGKVGNNTWRVLQDDNARRGYLTQKAQTEAAKMETLRKGSTGLTVFRLQQFLSKWGYGVSTNGNFDDQTDTAVRQFQKSHGLQVDGQVGRNTWGVLLNDYARQASQTASAGSATTSTGGATASAGMVNTAKLTEADIQRCAAMLDVEVAAIKAVKYVESGGRSGYLSSGRPVIRFEGHWFWKFLETDRHWNPQNFVKGNEDILYRYDKNQTQHKGGEGEYVRLEKAQAIYEEGALKSASWGLFQIMGFNYVECGCASVKEFVARMRASEGEQLMLFGKFLKKKGLDKFLRAHNWAEFARHYNGERYADNKYDTKLRDAYNSYKKA